jgi:hypothetical protein
VIEPAGMWFIFSYLQELVSTTLSGLGTKPFGRVDETILKREPTTRHVRQWACVK